MIYIVLGLIGAVAGSIYLYGKADALVGAGIGLVVAAVINQRNRLMAMEQRLKTLEATLARKAASTVAFDAKASAHDVASPPVPDNHGQPAGADDHKTHRSAEAVATPPMAAPASAADSKMPSLELELADDLVDDLAGDTKAAKPGAAPPRPLPSSATSGTMHPVGQWLLGGNLVVRAGIVVLLFGFAFLIKYAAARNLMPLELRLAAAFAAGIGLLVLGWRLRARRFAYAITLQGGGIGVMYLTLFAAARLFHLVPIPLVFALMIGLVFFSGALAVLQNAAAMAVIGAAGGFMAPVLLSTGSGSHIMLFSYYALLNAGIFGIAWFRAWRWLNLLGFVFTFGIGSVWGTQYYQPAYFNSTEPFLVLFFLFYLTIAVLFALRQPPQLKGYVDGTLVFGLPLVVFSLQIGLVKSIPYGLAYSALVMALIYAGLATALWRRCEEGLRTLVEAFLALGVIFGSLAIPLALSGSWTAVTWSLEGAGLVWIGLRQRRWTARVFGLLLQVGSGALFLIESHGSADPTLFFNSRFLGAMMMGLAGLFSAFMLERHQQRLHRLERNLAPLAMAWGLVWWFATGITEIDRALDCRYEWAGWMSFVGFSALAMGIGYRRLDWNGIRFPAMGLLPAMILAGALLSQEYYLHHPFQGWWAVLWPVLFAVHVYLLYVMDAAWPATLCVVWHTTGLLLATVLFSWEAGWMMDRVADGTPVWRLIAWGSVPAAVLYGAMRLGQRLKWPSAAFSIASQAWFPQLLAAGLVAWSVLSLSSSGNPRPLPYLPLFNPLDLVQVFVFLVMINWIVYACRQTDHLPLKITPLSMGAVAALCMLFWLTAVVARSVHTFASVPYVWEAMLRANLFHAAVSVLWGLVALGGMIAAHRLCLRNIWFSGAGLLAVVVIKLFVVDLSGSGTISRIVSFLAVGILMLVIGFFTPLPPAASKGIRS
ncbi:uncharacterized membrane protein, DUF2339 [Desulfosarcina variabilis str. Montpellier]|uniref:DUF2339 domain-containing protein n=1 Tax=Desulfosarcina variabilis TaxID=2300 RepID=UPI003AFA55E3